MQDIFETKKYLDENYEKIESKKKLQCLKANVVGKDADLKAKIKLCVLSLTSFFSSFMS